VSGPTSLPAPEDLAWVEDAIGIEHLLHLFHHLDRLRAQLHANVWGLGDAHPMLSRKGSAEAEGESEDLLDGDLGLPLLLLVLVIDHDTGVDVPISSMAEVDNLEILLFSDPSGLFDKGGDLISGDGDVFGDLGGIEAVTGRRDGLASLVE